MQVTLRSTTKIVTLNGLPARIWEGQTESGIKVHAFITRIACDKDETKTTEFENELQECDPPSAGIEVYSLKLII